MHDFQKNIQNCRHVGKHDQVLLASWYAVNKKKCLECGKNIPLGATSVSEYKDRKFCNIQCSATYHNRFKKASREVNNPQNWCKYCGKPIPKKNQYCSNQCQQQFHSEEYIKQWENNEIDGSTANGNLSKIIRKRLIRDANNMCSKCGWNKVNQFTGMIPLEIHHKDGDWTNNVKNNLEVLCPNCHSLTKTYKGANHNKGRTYRRSQVELEYEFD